MKERNQKERKKEKTRNLHTNIKRQQSIDVLSLF